MILIHKGVPFTLTTVDMKRAPEVLRDLAPGSQPPFLLYNNEVKTDTNKIEEFLEELLQPPSYPKMAPEHKESFQAGSDVFHKFSAYIKNQLPAQEDALQRNLLKSLLLLDKYMLVPLPQELKANPNQSVSQRKFLDGDTLTLPDCNLLPKLNIINTVCKYYRKFEIPKDLKGVTRYMENASQMKEFKYTCPNTEEILLFYRSWVKPMN
eukprot:XP_017952432.1 PREDICTED: chloride intracellular channel protein 3 isoform X2 [Xenopus tropicalis]